tara:strand:- start:82 stop:348 length:267 start_codon:yes stop_codon:yes gene_type:complete
MTPIEIILSVFLLTSICANIIQLRRQETLESWFEEMTTDLTQVQSEIEIIDEKKWFEADDEVGDTFRRLKETINKLDKFTGEEEDGDN